MNLLIIKLLTTIMFFISGIYKLVDPSIAFRKLSKCPCKNILTPFINLINFQEDDFIKIIVFLAGLWEIIGTLLIFKENKQHNIVGIYSLVVFTIIATLLCHYPPKGKDYYPFISNVTTVGGLLCLAELIKNN